MNEEKVILIVDDYPENLKVLGNILRTHGYFPIFAQSGIKALNAIKNKVPDLILLDILMPEMDGFEVCKRLKQDSSLADIPVIFLTAKTEKEDVIAGLELGAVDYVTKPFNSKELMTRVNTHIELKAAKAELNQKVAELKQANATKDKFYSIIAHDLGNLFHLLLLLSSRLTDKKAQLSAEEKDQFIQNCKYLILGTTC